MTTSVESDTEALRVLAGRATNLERWGDEFAASCNEVKDRVECLEHWSGGCTAGPGFQRGEGPNWPLMTRSLGLIKEAKKWAIYFFGVLTFVGETS